MLGGPDPQVGLRASGQPGAGGRNPVGIFLFGCVFPRIPTGFRPTAQGFAHVILRGFFSFSPIALYPTRFL